MTSEDTDTARQLIVGSSPHAHSGATIRRIMLDVIIALLPALVVSVFFFGVDAVRLTVVCVLSCVATEAACRKAMGRDIAIDDLSAVVTGMLLAFNLPPSLPTWLAIVGSIFAIGIAKQLFGGLGYNPFNPALTARAALLISSAVLMGKQWTEWTIPSPAEGVVATTTATPLQLAASTPPSLVFEQQAAIDLFLGRTNGCLGEVSALALLVGAAYLLYRRCISWHVPTFFVGTVAIFSGILWFLAPEQNLNPLFHVLSGGLMLGALFMATDMVTTPVTVPGMMIFGIGCGIITMVIRKWSGLPEGVSFSILFMNAFTPLLNSLTKPRVFGTGKK